MWPSRITGPSYGPAANVGRVGDHDHGDHHDHDHDHEHDHGHDQHEHSHHEDEQEHDEALPDVSGWLASAQKLSCPACGAGGA